MEVQRKWADDVGCPEGVFAPLNIDAKVNAAYVVIGLLYGEGDFTKTLEISTRCGQDADCNPSSAGGILGTVLGYDAIPAYWKQGLKEAEDIPFKYTTSSLNDVYATGLKHALQNIRRNGGTIEGDKITIMQQTPVPVKLEQSFAGTFPIDKKAVQWSDAKDEISFEFEGAGFVIRGDASRWDNRSDYVFKTELYVDGQLVEKPLLPVAFTTRRYDIAWNYLLPKAKHTVRLKILNPSSEHKINIQDALIYADKPVNGIQEAAKKAKAFKAI
jgi:hypothetical protein